MGRPGLGNPVAVQARCDKRTRPDLANRGGIFRGSGKNVGLYETGILNFTPAGFAFAKIAPDVRLDPT